MPHFSLTYFHCVNGEISLDTIIRTNAETFADAVEVLWNYITPRILNGGEYNETFIELAGDNHWQFNLFDYTNDDDEPVTDEELERLFNNLSVEDKHQVVEWVFNCLNDEPDTKAEFSIIEHEVVVEPKNTKTSPQEPVPQSSFLRQLKESMEEDGEPEQWSYGRSEKLTTEISLGSGKRLEVTYYTQDDRGLDNIEKAVLYEGCCPFTLDEDEINLLAQADII